MATIRPQVPALYVVFGRERDHTELPVSGREYGMLAEGYFSKLTFQGTRYLLFGACVIQ